MLLEKLMETVKRPDNWVHRQYSKINRKIEDSGWSRYDLGSISGAIASFTAIGLMVDDMSAENITKLLPDFYLATLAVVDVVHND
ncbi:MAG: hypothetical protein IIA49_03630, partial [Bacteroidetes bacterium]|nr:hypothetical protein [Bacteroidota bacterium]